MTFRYRWKISENMEKKPVLISTNLVINAKSAMLQCDVGRAKLKEACHITKMTQNQKKNNNEDDDEKYKGRQRRKMKE